MRNKKVIVVNGKDVFVRTTKLYASQIKALVGEHSDRQVYIGSWPNWKELYEDIKVDVYRQEITIVPRGYGLGIQSWKD